MTQREIAYVSIASFFLFMCFIIIPGMLDDAAKRDLLRECIKPHQPAECRQMVYGDNGRK